MEFFPTQQKFAEAVFSNEYRYLMFGGAIRGGKSYISIALILALCRIFPGSRWAIVRKDLPTLRRNTLPTFNKIAPDGFCSPINQGTWTVKCQNGSEILFFPESLKQDPDHDRWKGLEVNGFLLEEANELAEASFSKAIERAGSWTAASKTQPPPIILLTCNPARNWVYRTFYRPWRDGTLDKPYYYLPSRPDDNPHLTDEYRESLERLKDLDEAAYLRFVKGDWDQDTDASQLITYDWCLASLSVEDAPGENALGVDVARFGRDQTALAHATGNRLWRLESHAKLSIDQTADIVQLRIQGNPVASDNVRVDSVGLGAGVVDILHRNGCKVREVVGGAKPIPREESVFKFANLRSQLWWELREKLRKGEIFVDLPSGKRRNQLFEDLCAPRYTITSDKVIQVEAKELTKKRIGRSPDMADSMVYAFADLSPSEPEWYISL